MNRVGGRIAERVICPRLSGEYRSYINGEILYQVWAVCASHAVQRDKRETSRTASGATRNHPTFATKHATLIFRPSWIHRDGEKRRGGEERGESERGISNISRTVCAETCVRQILRDYRPHG